MPTQVELLQEAYTRGILPPEKKALYDAAVERGLIKAPKQYDITPQTAKRLSELEAAQVENVERLQRSIPPLTPNADEEAKARHKKMYYPDSSDLVKARRTAELEKRGVVTNLELPAGNKEMGFALDPIAGLQKSLTEHYKQPVKVYKDKEDILFIDPTDGQTKRANPDWISKLGQGLPIVGDIAGTIGGGVLGGAISKSPAGVVAGETAGSGLGTGIGEAIRLSVGNALGVNDLSTDDIAIESVKIGGEAALATAVTGGLIASVKGVNNFVKGGIFTRDEAAKYGLTVQEADEAIKEVNKIAGQKGAVKGTLGRKSDDVVAQAGEEQVRRNVSHAQDFVDRDVADQAGLVKALDATTTPGAKQGGQAIQDVATTQSEKRLSQAKGIVATNEKELASQLDDIGKVAKETIGEPTRAFIGVKSDLKKGAEQFQWDKVKRVGGYNPEKQTYGIDISEGVNTAKLKKQLKARSDTATTKITGKGTASIYKPGTQKADLANYNREISDLRAQSRAAKKNKQFGDPDTRDLDQVVESMIQDRRLALIKEGRGDVLKQIEKAERQTAKFHKVYDRSIIGDLTAKNKNGVYKIKDKEFVDKMLKADKEEISQLMSVIGDNPSLVNQWKEGVADSYKRVAYPDGKFSRRASKSFIDANKQNLEAIGFKAKELDKWAETGGLAKKVADQSDRLKKLIHNANKTWGKGKLKSMDSNGLVKFVTNDTGSFSTPSGLGVQSMVKKIDYVKNITKNYPAAWESFKTEYSTGVRNAVFDIKKKQVDYAKLNKVIAEQGSAIEKVMGTQYLNDLKSINEVSRILSKPLKSLSGSEQTAGIIQIARGAIAPPLTRRGRAFTAAIIFERKSAHDAMAKAFLNPTAMHEIAKLSHHSKITRETAELAVSLGLITSDDE